MVAPPPSTRQGTGRPSAGHDATRLEGASPGATFLIGQQGGLLLESGLGVNLGSWQGRRRRDWLAIGQGGLLGPGLGYS